MIDQETGEVITPFIRTPYNYDTDKVTNETGLDCGPTSRTKQEFKEETDINTIVEQFTRSGEMPPTIPFPTEQDFTDTKDFQESMNVIVQARESFMELPAKSRARFHNDPQEFMEFIHNPDNIKEAERLKLVTIREEIKKPEEPTAVKAPEPVKDKKE